MNKRVLIIRNFASKVNINSYNLQEIGLGKAFVKKGFNVDIVYYSNDQLDQIVFEAESYVLKVKWTKAIKFLSNSIYYSLLRKKILKQYDIIITTEYNQIMSFLLSLVTPNKLYLYHGPYQDNNNKFVQKIYDMLFTPFIRNRVSKVFTKSDLANDYLKHKGFKNIKTIGVGLDIEKLECNLVNNNKLEIIKSINLKKKNLLYIGVLEDRRNIEFLFKVFSNLKKRYSNVNLVIVGDGKQEDKIRYCGLAEKLNIKKDIIYYKKLEQSQLKYLYEEMDLFIFPTNYDIFGMVLLESMYFGLPVISTFNGGSQTLINKDNGIIINELDEDIWVNTICNILMNQNTIGDFSQEAHEKIISEFTWDKIVDKILFK